MTGPFPGFAEEYYKNVDLRVVQAVPAEARSILDIDCGEGYLGEVLKHLNPERHVSGITRRTEHSEASARLDRVIVADLDHDEPNLAKGSFDCIVADNVLARYRDPCAVLKRLRPLLRSGGRIVASLPNLQHWSFYERLLRGELPWQENDALANTRFLSAPGLVRLFLDAGFLPLIVDRRSVEPPTGWHEAMRPAIERQRLDPAIFAARSRTWQYIVTARAIDGLPDATATTRPVTVGACTNDADVLRENLLASPCLQDAMHQTLMVEGAASAAEGLNAVIDQAQHELVVLAHQDVYLPEWWVAKLWQQYELARRLTGDRVGVMGVYGVRGSPQGVDRFGRVADRDFLLDEPMPLPAGVESLDELVLITPRGGGARFDPALGFHLYGTDICLSAVNAGREAIVIDAPCHHNSKQGDQLPAAFERSRRILGEKWASRLPVATPCCIII